LDRAAGLGVKDQAPQPFLRGKDLLDRGMKPGKEIGRILEQAFELQLDGALADREAAVVWLNQEFPEQKT
jgi:tRNA nucleotidyltransferase (CCA-adding enzyme)